MKNVVLLVVSVLIAFLSYSCITPDPSNSTGVSSESGLLSNILKRSFENNQHFNTIVSGLSVDFALCMLTNGADGESRTQLEKVWDDDLEYETKYLNEQLGNLSSTHSLDISNTIWGTGFRNDYKTKIEKELEAGVKDLPSNTKVINDWITTRTNGRTKNLLQEIKTDPNNLYLVNTVFFKGRWDAESVFNESQTNKENFHSLSGKDIDVLMMHKEGYMDYAESDNIVAVRLFYEEKMYNEEKGYMEIFLPKDGSDFVTFIKNVSERNDLVLNYNREKVKLSLPRFNIETETDMKVIFQELGVRDVFDVSKANFANMVEKASYVKEFKQKAVVSVQEKGTEVGAISSGVSVATNGTVSLDYIDFRVDRPFLFYISEGDFLGVYTGSSKEN